MIYNSNFFNEPSNDQKVEISMTCLILVTNITLLNTFVQRVTILCQFATLRQFLESLFSRSKTLVANLETAGNHFLFIFSKER